MTFRRIVQTWFWLVLLCVLAGAAAGFVIGWLTPPSYASTVSMIIAPPASSTAVTINDIQVAQALTPSYAELATSRTLLDRVIATSGVNTTADKLAGQVSTHVPVGTSLLQVTVTDRDGVAAAKLANSIAAELAVFKMTGSTLPSGDAVTLNVVDPAVPSTRQLGLGATFSAAVGGAIGLILVLGLAFIVENIRSAAARADREASGF